MRSGRQRLPLKQNAWQTKFLLRRTGTRKNKNRGRKKSNVQRMPPKTMPLRHMSLQLRLQGLKARLKFWSQLLQHHLVDSHRHQLPHQQQDKLSCSLLRRGSLWPSRMWAAPQF